MPSFKDEPNCEPKDGDAGGDKGTEGAAIFDEPPKAEPSEDNNLPNIRY
jgi:hypothetical protein